MMIAQYETRLPVDHDMAALREWLAERGGVWDGMPELHFKAILTREAGSFGARENSWSSVYLWRQDQAFRDWLVRGGYEVVTDRYGRAGIESFVALDAFRGPASDARFLYRDDVAITVDTNPTGAIEEEIERSRQRATDPDVVAACVGIDPLGWKAVRITLSDAEPTPSSRGVPYQVAYLSRSLFDALPVGSEK